MVDFNVIYHHKNNIRAITMLNLKKKKDFDVPHLATCIFLFFYNEPELGVGIDPGMALTPLPSSIGHESNPRPSDHEPSTLPLDHSFGYHDVESYVISSTSLLNIAKFV